MEKEVGACHVLRLWLWFLNASISYIPVSLAMTLRAAEPLFSVALVAIFFAKSASEAVSAELGMTLLPIVAGTSMSSFGSAEFSFMGLVLVCIANVAFPLRTIIYKRCARRPERATSRSLLEYAGAQRNNARCQYRHCCARWLPRSL